MIATRTLCGAAREFALEVMQNLVAEGLIVNGRHHIVQSCMGGDLKLPLRMARAMWVLVEVPVHLLQGKKRAPFQDQVSLGSLWWTAYTND
jgi:hypothetical protein